MSSRYNKFYIIIFLLSLIFCNNAWSQYDVAPAYPTLNSKQSAPTTAELADNAQLDKYYDLKFKNPLLANAILEQLAKENSQSAKTQKKLGFAFSEVNQPLKALPHFLLAAKLDPMDYEAKIEIGYIYDDSDRDKQAFYKYKEVATNSPDPNLRLKAEQSMVDIAGVQTQFLPHPYFSDLYFAPYYLPRWPDMIFPGIFRIGRNFGSNNQVQVYGIIYYNQDTASIGGQASPIIADNSVVSDLGIRYQPFKNFPAYAYVEGGEGYNIIRDEESDNTQWTPDLRGGLDFYTDWGYPPHYANTKRFPFKQIGDVYFDFSYFSRYNDDWIGQLIAREGFRIFEFKNTSVDIYWKVNAIFDTRHYFYNNLIETGPGIAITPYNLLNIRLRFELARGYYVPVNSIDPNPYGSTYNASMVTLETYFSF
ncbi:MAG TPA: tetratricopeptide repeat protein [Gammaproteobacteria bacterium]|nr:tetratricopeptide repeat protein [Gammaproteobacteria bacterium]